MADNGICQVSSCVNTASDPLGFCAPHLDAIKSRNATVKIALPTCTVEGCELPPHSGFYSYCTAHNGRLRRRGSLYQAPFAQAIQHSHGYLLVLAKGHPMARGLRAYEHRVVFYDHNPDGPGHCAWCGLVLNWDSVQVDHLNRVRDDNRIENLAASCGPCNRDRAKPFAAKAANDRARGYMVNGKWLSIVDAARSLGVTPNSITGRLKKGWSVERAMTERRGRTGPKRSEAKRDADLPVAWHDGAASGDH